MTKGVERAPNRSLLYALGFTKEEMERPLVGIVSSYNEIVPGHMNLDKIVEAVKAGVRLAGGTPIVFPAIAVCDGIAMNVKLDSFSLNAVTDGEDAIGEAVVKISNSKGEIYTGTGLSTDIIESSIRAYVNGINKMIEATV